MKVFNREGREAVFQRLLLDFLGETSKAIHDRRRMTQDWRGPASFFRSTEFRHRALALLRDRILGRPARDDDHWLVAMVEQPSIDLATLATAILASAEYFDEQCGENAAFFCTRVMALLLGGMPSSQDIEALPAPDARLAFVRARVNSAEAYDLVLRLVYDSVGLGHFVPRRLTASAGTKGSPFFIETILGQAVSERKYKIDARRGLSSRLLAQRRLVANLEMVAERGDLVARQNAEDLSRDILSGSISAYEGSRSLLKYLKNAYSPASKLGRSLARRLDLGPDMALPAFLTDLVSRRHGRQPAMEAEYRALACPIAEAVAQSWLDTFTLSALASKETFQRWVERLCDCDGLLETLSDFILSDDFLGATGRLLQTADSIGPVAGCFVDGSTLTESYRAIVTTSFFYWYDIIDGASFIACPDTAVNEPGQDSLTVAPANRDCFTCQSTRWHRDELEDMREAGVNVVMPVALTTPLSWQKPPIRTEEGRTLPERLHFPDLGLRVLRRTMLEMMADGLTPPKVAMFYDTSTLNRHNIFGLKINFIKRFANSWFYESIRNFFSHFPPSSWATFEGKPIVFVYHPSFGDCTNETIYPYVRQRFFREFGSDLYIVTAAEDEAPRVLQKEQIASDVASLQSEGGIETLARLLAQGELYAGAQLNDQLYMRTLVRRLIPRADTASFLSRHGKGPFSDSAERLKFVKAILASEEFAWETTERWFRHFLRVAYDAFDPRHEALGTCIRRAIFEGDWLAALTEIICSDLFFAAAGGTNARFFDWIYQSVAMKHVNTLCTPNYNTIYSDEAPKLAFLVALESQAKASAVREFLSRFDVCEGIVSRWYYEYFGWYNPGVADSTFYWTAAISPLIQGVASVGPGYDQAKLRYRPPLHMPRQDGKTYNDAWDWVISMRPCPSIVHLESWNEFFEGTAICNSKEFGRTYIELTKHHSDRFYAVHR